jgi:hypothetical protein
MKPTPARRRVPTGKPASQGAGEVKLAVMIPDALGLQLRITAARERKTLRTIVLEALRSAGYSVTDDMIADRRVEANRRRGAPGTRKRGF